MCEGVMCEGCGTVLFEVLTREGSWKAVLPFVGRVFSNSELHCVSLRTDSGQFLQMDGVDG